VIAEAEDQATSSELQSVLPLLSLTTTQLSFSTLTRVLFRIAFRYKCVGAGSLAALQATCCCW
jgi:hypothetical protein